ncbi:hypothetical protein PspLS_03674 [Pyricularia sp. CBS 133598]|nr:hypothetical protein PspLS_03674 [Pyricularia sp. CBS 133598]
MRPRWLDAFLRRGAERRRRTLERQWKREVEEGSKYSLPKGGLRSAPPPPPPPRYRLPEGINSILKLSRSPHQDPKHQSKRPSDVLGKLALLEKIIDYHFDEAHVQFAIEALNTAIIPYHYRRKTGTMRTNQSLAIYGDIVSAATLCEFWMDNRPAHGLVPRNWSALQMDLLGNINLARVGKSAGLGACLINDDIDEVLFLSKKLAVIRMATSVEAILGAVYKAGGPRSLRAVMERLGLFRHPLLGTEERVDKNGRGVSGGKLTPKIGRSASKPRPTSEIIHPTDDPDCGGAAFLK